MSVVHVVGARPNFPKLAPVFKALQDLGITQTIIHTGQHFDDAMSGALIRDLGLPKPDLNLGVGGGSHATQTAAVLTAIEPLLIELGPRAIVLYGDVNSTVAAALAAAKLHIPIIHVEAGLRSFDNCMPEEINRKITDLLSDLLLITSPEAETNLLAEGKSRASIKFVGNPMIDSLHSVLGEAKSRAAQVLKETDLFERDYALVTLHRPSNVDDSTDFAEITSILTKMSSRLPILFPAHPRVQSKLAESKLSQDSNIFVVSPQPYATFVGLTASARVVVTDSGGIQEETTALGVPCLTLRNNTERPITITEGTNQLVTRASLISDLDGRLASTKSGSIPALWDGHAGLRIAHAIKTFIQNAGSTLTTVTEKRISKVCS